MRCRLWPVGGDYVNATTPYGPHGIVYDRLADFDNPSLPRPRRFGGEALMAR